MLILLRPGGGFAARHPADGVITCKLIFQGRGMAVVEALCAGAEEPKYTALDLCFEYPPALGGSFRKPRRKRLCETGPTCYHRPSPIQRVRHSAAMLDSAPCH